MPTRRDFIEMHNNIYNLPNDNSPIKKSWDKEFGKVMQDSWTITMRNTKNVRVVYGLNFQRTPIVVLQLNDNSNVPPFKTDANSNSFTIKFQTNFTGDVEWIATERP